MRPALAFLDDSGTHTNNSPICVAAGYFGGAHYWKLFSLDWEKAIKDRGLVEFHANRFWAGGVGGKTFGEYAGWSQSDCESLLDDLIAVLKRYPIRPFGSAVVASDWNALTLDERRFLTGGSFLAGEHKDGGAPTKPYFAAFLFAVQNVSFYYDKGHSIDFTMDESKSLEGYARIYFQKIKSSSFARADRLGTLSPGDSKDQPGLQAADLLAYLMLRTTRDAPEVNKEIDDDTPLGRAVGKARNLKQDFKLFNKRAFDQVLTRFRKSDPHA